MTTKNPYRCPKCGTALIKKEGIYGQFMACPRYPDCQYTRALWTYQAAHEKPYCEKCKGEERLPLRRKSDNSVIPYAWIYCDCHKEEDLYNPVRPEDFDFPISYSFYRSLCHEYSWPDPGPDKAIEEEKLPEPRIEMKRYVSYQNVDGKQLSALRKNLTQYIDEKLNEIQDKKKVGKQQYTIK